MLLRPTTTASLPFEIDAGLVEQLHAAVRRAGEERLLADEHPADVLRVEPVDVLGRVDRLDDGLLIDVVRQRELHEDAVDLGRRR